MNFIGISYTLLNGLEQSGADELFNVPVTCALIILNLMNILSNRANKEQ